MKRTQLRPILPVSLPAALIIIFLLGGCSLPRITVLDDPLTARDHLKLAAAYEKNAEYDLAEREYLKAAREIPEAHLFLANMYFVRKDYGAAEKEYRKAIKALPENPQPFNNLAWLYYTLNSNLEEAEELARRAVELAGPEQSGPYRDTLDRIRHARNL